jgi:sugar-specific transcriptional regulator TrmB
MSDDARADADDEDAVAALERLGLSNYEARSFVALQRLGTGTARDVHEETGIPRSQVYGAADELEERGLVSVQQSRPKRYRPVELEEARERLTAEFERDREAAFDHLERVRREPGPSQERQEDVWTITGSDAIDTRMTALTEEAKQRVAVATDDAAYLPDETFEALRRFHADGGEVVAISRTAAIRESFEAEGMVAVAPPEQLVDPDNDRSARLVLVDEDALLLSVLADEEIAIWSAHTTFARVFGGLLRQGLLGAADGDPDDGTGGA